ncbi:diguanylate cyclase [Massilia buxea]|uniref:diguanylate cyclase n=1 Tax=Pseudoduganella buxea TaxID=1949069 RepID=A0A6I3SVK3_9BURK|nr:diguanylate cyclase [Pseudoduganella buxea]
MLSSVVRTARLRRWAAALLLCPALAFGEDTLATRLDDAGAKARSVPDQALRELRAMAGEVATAPPALRADFLYFSSTAERTAGDVPRALALADELVAFGERQGDDVALVKGLLERANAQWMLGKVPASHATSLQAERVARRIADVAVKVQSAISAGQAYQEQGNYPAGLARLQGAVDLARQIEGDTAPLGNSLYALVWLYLNMGQLDKAAEAQRESLLLARAAESPARIAVALGTEYALAIEQKAFRRARRALLEALGLERSIGARQMTATTLVYLSDSYLKERKFQEARTYGAQALQAAIDVNSVSDIATARVNLGQAYLGLGLLAEGKRHVDAGLATYEKQGDKPELQAVLLEYGGALEHAGDYRGAIGAYHRERDIAREMFADERRAAVLELQEKYDAERTQRQIEALRRDNRAAGAELEHRRLQQRIWWLLAGACALAAATVALMYRKVRQANARLAERNVELKRQGSLDPLTGLYNRRHFQAFMAAGQEGGGRRATDGDTVGALFLLDVDHFKHVNDTFGHAAGDEVLKLIAAGLREALRETDMIVRWGGEEFLVFLPAVARAGLDDVARRILYGISSRTVAYQGAVIPVNVSVGFAPYPLMAGTTPLAWERVVNLADMALYLAKSNGRNRAVGVRGFPGLDRTTVEAVEADLEHAWHAGFVDLAVVPGGAPGEARPEGRTD